MKYALMALFGIFFLFEMSFPVNAVVTPPIDDIDFMMAKIQNNIKMASAVTKMAQTKSAAMVAQKVQEKKELKEAVVVAEAKVEKIQEKMEVYAVKMIGSGIDTAVEEVTFKGPAYEAWLNYVEEGGKEDFGYFRLYLWQQK